MWTERVVRFHRIRLHVFVFVSCNAARAAKIITINQMCQSTCQYACTTKCVFAHDRRWSIPIPNEMRLVAESSFAASSPLFRGHDIRHKLFARTRTPSPNVNLILLNAVHEHSVPSSDIVRGHNDPFYVWCGRSYGEASCTANSIHWLKNQVQAHARCHASFKKQTFNVPSWCDDCDLQWAN